MGNDDNARERHCSSDTDIKYCVQSNVKSGVKKAEKISDVFLKQNCNMLPFHV